MNAKYLLAVALLLGCGPRAIGTTTEFCDGCSINCQPIDVPSIRFEFVGHDCTTITPEYGYRIEIFSFSSTKLAFKAFSHADNPSQVDLFRATDPDGSTSVSDEDRKTELFEEAVRFLKSIGKVEFNYVVPDSPHGIEPYYDPLPPNPHSAA